MPKTYNPKSFSHQLTAEMGLWTRQVHAVLTGNVDLGVPIGQSPLGGVNSGVYTQFDKGNSSGILLRVDAHGSSGTGAPYTWSGSGVGLPLAHGLERLPIGFIVVDKDKAVDIWRTAAPTDKLITLAPSDNSASVTLYIF